MTDQVLDILKLVLLALLYLFFARVLWAVWSEVRQPADARTTTDFAPQQQQPAPVSDRRADPPSSRAGGRSSRPRVAVASQRRLVVLEPKQRRGTTFAIVREVSIGRETDNTIVITDDAYISGHHARVSDGRRPRRRRRSRIAQRHVSQRCPAHTATHRPQRRPDPGRLHRVGGSVNGRACGGAAPPTKGSYGPRTRTTPTPATVCSSSPTGWAATWPARSPARWRSTGSTTRLPFGVDNTPRRPRRRRSTRPTSRSTTDRSTNPDQAGMGTTVTAIAVVTDPHRRRGARDRQRRRLARLRAAPRPAPPGHDRPQLRAGTRRRRCASPATRPAPHPRRNIVTRALGIEPCVRVDSWTMPIIRGDRFVLCSDGLVDEIDRRPDHRGRSRPIPTIPAPPRRRLVDAANDAGGRDNITVVVFDVLEGDDPPDPTEEFDVDPGLERRRHRQHGRAARSSATRSPNTTTPTPRPTRRRDAAPYDGGDDVERRRCYDGGGDITPVDGAAITPNVTPEPAPPKRGGAVRPVRARPRRRRRAGPRRSRSSPPGPAAATSSRSTTTARS